MLLRTIFVVLLSKGVFSFNQRISAGFGTPSIIWQVKVTLSPSVTVWCDPDRLSFGGTSRKKKETLLVLCILWPYDTEASINWITDSPWVTTNVNFNSFFLFGRSYDAKFLGVGNFQFSSVFAFFIPLLTVFSNCLFLFNLWCFPHLGQRRGVVRAFLSFALFLYLLFSAVASLNFKYITDQRTPTNVHAFPAQFFSHFHLNIS